MLRDRMKAILDECRAAGYATTSTVANWHELYNTYKTLGGNHFREYVDAWKQELESLPNNTPTSVPRVRRVPRATVDILTAKSPIEDVELPEEVKELVGVGGKKGKK
jgi:hypothetical protein